VPLQPVVIIGLEMQGAKPSASASAARHLSLSDIAQPTPDRQIQHLRAQRAEVEIVYNPVEKLCHAPLTKERPVWFHGCGAFAALNSAETHAPANFLGVPAN